MFIQKSAETPKTLESLKAVLGVIPRLPLTISLTRWYGTFIAWARSRWVRPMGFKNSSSNISPGWVGVLWVGMRIIVILHPYFLVCVYP